MEATRILAEFLANTASEDIPDEAFSVAKQAFIDYLAVTLPGSQSEAGKLTMQFVREVGSAGKASVIGGNLHCHPTMAVLANGVSAHALDFDDYIPALGHASTILVSIGLALGEELDLDGRTILDAYILAVEGGAKIAAVMVPGHRDAGWHPTGTIGTIAGAAMAARLLRLNTEQIRATMALAASQAAGMLRNMGSMIKPFHAGNAAKSGLTAALLAQKGYSGAQEIFAGPLGFCTVYGGRGEELDAGLMKLGSPYHLVEYGINFKRYACCAGVHPGIDILLEFRERNGLQPEAVDKIDCWVKKSTLNTMPHRIPRDPDEGRFSIPFCLATALQTGKVGLAEFEDGKLQRPEIIAIINRVNLFSCGEENKVKLRVHLKNGEVLEAEKIPAKGSVDAPTGIEETQAKFAACSSGLLGPALAAEAVGLLEKFDHLANVHRLMEILSLSPSPFCKGGQRWDFGKVRR